MDRRIDLKRAVILAIDDMAINLRTMKMVLEKDYDLRLAKSGELALSILESESVDLILLDIEMPEMTGFDFMQKLKNNSTITQRPPVIFVTAHATPEFIARAKIAGAVGYILKPFDPDVLRKKIINALSQTGEAG
jgi:putative two-component system response regulator